MVTVKTLKKFRMVNPPHAPNVARAHRAKAARSNPLFVLGGVNPTKGKNKPMAQTKKKKTPPAAALARKKNPKVRAAKPQQFMQVLPPLPPKRRPKTKNPSLSSMAAQPLEFLKFGLIALLGLVATRQIPQMALAEKNQDWIGYLANLGTAVGGAYGAGRVAGPTAAIAWGTGGGLYVVNRILTDKLSPVGRVLSLAGIGDAQASNTLGRIVPGSIYPPAYDSAGNLRLPPAFVSAARAALMPPTPAAAGMSGGRLAGRGGAARIAA